MPCRIALHVLGAFEAIDLLGFVRHRETKRPHRRTCRCTPRRPMPRRNAQSPRQSRLRTTRHARRIPRPTLVPHSRLHETGGMELLADLDATAAIGAFLLIDGRTVEIDTWFHLNRSRRACVNARHAAGAHLLLADCQHPFDQPPHYAKRSAPAHPLRHGWRLRSQQEFQPVRRPLDS